MTETLRYTEDELAHIHAPKTAGHITNEPGRVVTLSLDAIGSVMMVFRPTERFVMTGRTCYRLDHVSLNKSTGDFTTTWIRQTANGRDWKRGGAVAMWPVNLSEEMRGLILEALSRALREAYRVPAGCVVTEEGFDSEEVPADELPGYGVRYRQAGQVKERWFQSAEGRGAWVRDMARWIEVTAEINPTIRKRLSDARLDGDVTRETHGDTGWMVQSDLSADLFEQVPNLGEKGARSLISGVCSGLPLVITWDTPFGEDRIERRTETVLVSRLVPPHPTKSTVPGRLRINYWGFEHDIYVDRIVSVSTPNSTCEFLDR